MASWEDTFKRWAKGPSPSEREKCENAEKAVRKAIDASVILAVMDISVFAQGSYRNRTNVRQDSDVDICVRLNTTFFPDYPSGKSRDDFGNSPGSIEYSEFRNLVEAALKSYFGATSVRRGNRAFDIHANTYRVDADVVAAFEHRRYTGSFNRDGSHHYNSGIGFMPDTGSRITNWPEQNYKNGVAKHEETGQRFKKIIRILKRLRGVLQEEGNKAAGNIASCLIEALVWNVPKEGFGHDTYTADVRHVLAYTFNATQSADKCKEWGEVNELIYLFHPGQPWTVEQTHAFLSAAWDRFGFS